MSRGTDDDTIFALSSGAVPAAIAVVRISGAAAPSALAALTGGKMVEPRRAQLSTLRDPGDGSTLDRALVLGFAGPATATGEDLIELHLHGGRAVVRGVLDVLGRLPGCRPAEPGEFTRRALLNGRIDLSMAEGLADLLTAESDAARRAALTMAGGEVRRRAERWSDEVLHLSARIEAELDFADEDDVPADALDAVAQDAGRIAAEIDAALATPSVERIRDGVRVVLAGPPNSGKSSLFNVLAGRDAAIVSPIAGTTRDRIEAWVERGGIGYTLVDTAGLRGNQDDAIEAIGIARAREEISTGDVVLWLGDDPPTAPNDVWLLPKADLREEEVTGRIAVSAHSGAGVLDVWQTVARISTFRRPAEAIALNERQRQLLRLARSRLTEAAASSDAVILAEEIRSARGALDAITGRNGTEQMLDTLFSRFCIGK